MFTKEKHIVLEALIKLLLLSKNRVENNHSIYSSNFFSEVIFVWKIMWEWNSNRCKDNYTNLEELLG